MKKALMYYEQLNNNVCSGNTFRIIKIVNLLLLVTVFNVFGSKTYSQFASLNLNTKSFSMVNKEIETPVSLQQNRITGTITDEKGNPLPGVTVKVKGATLGALTDASGKYVLDNAPQNATLVYSFIGMATQEIPSEGRNLIDIVLKEEVVGLEEVVVIGYGTQKKVNVIGSITAVTNKELTVAPVGSVSNALTGRLPGVIVMQDNGEPGADAATIRIRGNATLGNNSPLIVIDGIQGRDLNSLAPEDIESITVLKDASAAIYGSNAANGVILITSKRGVTDAPPTFNYNYYGGFLSPTLLPKMADAATYATMIRETQLYRGVAESNMIYSLDDVEKFKSGQYPWTHPNTDWFAEALKDHSSTQHHSLSVSGGTKNVSYYSSFGTQFDDGIYTNSATSFKRYTLKAKIDVKLNEYLNIGLDISGNQENRMYPTKSTTAIFERLVRMRPTEPALFPNGLPGPDIEFGDQPMVSASFATGFDDDKRYNSNNIFSATLKIPWIKGLSLSGYYGYDKYFQQRKLFQKPWTLYNLDKVAYLAAGNTGKEDGSAFLLGSKKGYEEPRLTNYSENSESKTANIKLDYTKTFNDKHNLSAFISYEQNQSSYDGFNAFRRFFITDRLPYLFAGGNAEKDNSEYAGLDVRMNYFGRLSYNFKETYLFQFSFRRDGSLRFSKEAGRWGNFPAILVGWRPSKEVWWQNKLGFINDFKLKASWGKLGNDRVGAFQYLSSYGYTEGYTFGASKNYSDGLIQSNVPNPFITWEVANMYNVGWESAFLNNRITFDADFFYQRRNNILVQRNASVPDFTGLSLPDENFGIVDNQGFELVLGYNKQKGNFTYNFSGNFAFARNKIVEYDEPERNVPWQVRTGHPQEALLLYKSIGIFRDQEQVNSLPHVVGARAGDIIIEDFDGDGKITNDDRQLFPLTTTPEITFGMTFNLRYKNFELNGLLQGQGRALRNIYSTDLQGSGGNYFEYDAINRWTPENPNGTRPRAFERGDEYWRSSYITDFNYTDISYLRLKSLKLIYSVPQNIINSMAVVKNARIYIAGQNLWLIYSGNKIMDPEVAGMGSYPIMKVMSIGAELTF